MLMEREKQQISISKSEESKSCLETEETPASDKIEIDEQFTYSPDQNEVKKSKEEKKDAKGKGK
jgi:hypothetical protein